ncbi:MAG: hypothetical protein ACK42L_08840, partial [Thermoanaerobaculum sp.]
YGQVSRWQEHVEIVAKTVIVRVDSAWLESPELFDSALWDVYVSEIPARVLSVQKLLARGVNGQSEKMGTVEPSGSLAAEWPATTEESGTTILLLARACDRRNLARSITKLASQAEDLLVAGPVSVGVVDRTTRMLCARVKNPDELRTCLKTLEHEKTANEILRLRRWGRDLQGSSTRVVSLAGLVEERAVTRSLFREVTNAVRVSGAGAGLVILIWDGADGDPWEFWGQFAEGQQSFENEKKSPQKGANSGAPRGGENVGAEWSEMEAWAREFAVDGKVVVSVFPGFGSSMYPDWAAARSGSSRFREFMDARQEWQPSRGASEYLLLADAHRVPRFMAEVTGGTVINPKDTVKDAWRRLEGVLAITFQIQGPVGCDTFPVTISHKTFGRPTQVPKAVRFCSPYRSKPDLVNLVDAGEGFLGIIVVHARVERFEKRDNRTSEAVVKAEWGGGPALGKWEENAVAQWQITMGVVKEVESSSATRTVHLTSPQRLPGQETQLEAHLVLPADGNRLLVLVEDVLTGAWGAAVVDLLGQGKP